MSKKKRRKTRGGRAADSAVRGILNDVHEDEEIVADPLSEEGDASDTGEDAIAGGPAVATSSVTSVAWPGPFLGRLLDAYEVLAYTFGIGMTVAMIVARNGGNGLVQWVLGIIAMLATVLAKTVFASDFNDIYDEAKAKAEAERRRDIEELEGGNYDGVPKSIVEMLKYPSAEDYEQLRQEAERQKQLLRDFKRARKDAKGGKKSE